MLILSGSEPNLAFGTEDMQRVSAGGDSAVDISRPPRPGTYAYICEDARPDAVTSVFHCSPASRAVLCHVSNPSWSRPPEPGATVDALPAWVSSKWRILPDARQPGTPQEVPLCRRFEHSRSTQISDGGRQRLARPASMAKRGRRRSACRAREGRGRRCWSPSAKLTFDGYLDRYNFLRPSYFLPRRSDHTPDMHARVVSAPCDTCMLGIRTRPYRKFDTSLGMRPRNT